MSHICDLFGHYEQNQCASSSRIPKKRTFCMCRICASYIHGQVSHAKLNNCDYWNPFGKYYTDVLFLNCHEYCWNVFFNLTCLYFARNFHNLWHVAHTIFTIFDMSHIKCSQSLTCRTSYQVSRQGNTKQFQGFDTYFQMCLSTTGLEMQLLHTWLNCALPEK